jgi:hypothetical protein
MCVCVHGKKRKLREVDEQKKKEELQLQHIIVDSKQMG